MEKKGNNSKMGNQIYLKIADAVHQPTWPLLLKIEHMVKL
jgi:hypothetical protein